jgi:hypothetical protein
LFDGRERPLHGRSALHHRLPFSLSPAPSHPPLSLLSRPRTGRARRPVAGPGWRGQGRSAAPAAEHAGVAGKGREGEERKNGRLHRPRPHHHPSPPFPRSSRPPSPSNKLRSPPPPRRPPWSSPKWLPPTCPPGRGRSWCRPCWRRWPLRPRLGPPPRPPRSARPPWRPWATCARRWGGGRMTSWSRR